MVAVPSRVAHHPAVVTQTSVIVGISGEIALQSTVGVAVDTMRRVGDPIGQRVTVPPSMVVDHLHQFVLVGTQVPPMMPQEGVVTELFRAVDRVHRLPSTPIVVGSPTIPRTLP